MQTLQARIAGPIATGTRATRAARLTCRAQAPVLPPKPRSPVEQASLALAAASVLPPLTALPALADEAAPAVDAAAAAPSVLGFTPFGLALSFSPLLVYGAFYLYRQNVNPRAKLSDLVFIIAAAVIVGNIVSILVFKKRIF